MKQSNELNKELKQMRNSYCQYLACNNCGWLFCTWIPKGITIEQYDKENPICRRCGCARSRLKYLGHLLGG